MAEPNCDGACPVAGGSCGRVSGRARCEASRFARDARGSTAMEYALIGGLIFVVAAGSIRYYGSRMVPIYDKINTAVTQSH